MGRKERQRKGDSAPLAQVVSPDGDDEQAFVTPVGAGYYAISPEESVTSAHELKQGKFEELFEVTPVADLRDLFVGVTTETAATINAKLEETPPCKKWSAHKLGVKIQNMNSEGLMNAEVQTCLRDSLSSVNGLGIYNETESKEKVGFVKEKAMRTLLEVCYGDNKPRQGSINGLPISLESKPDYVVWSKSKSMMLTGEGKNHSKYNPQDSLRQSVTYMLVNLFRCVVWKSKAVDAVYGVSICGPKCSDMNGKKYIVNLLRLSLPDTFGGKLHLMIFDVVDLDHLWKFTNAVCTINLSGAKDIEMGGSGCPARMLVPKNILQQSCSSLDGWRMIKNSNASLVIRLENGDGLDFVAGNLNCALLLKKRWLKDIKQNEVGFPCFFKLKNHLGTHEPYGMHFYLVLDDDEEAEYLFDLQQAYKVKPVIHTCGIFFVMSDMGIPIVDPSCEARRLDYAVFTNLFFNLMNRTTKILDLLLFHHGDIHVGNLVYNQSAHKLCLIDYDEGSSKSPVIARKPITTAQKRIFVSGLRKSPLAFTKNQFINLFCECWTMFLQGNTKDAATTSSVDAFVRMYHDLFVRNQNLDAGQVDSTFHALITCLNAGISNEEGIEVQTVDDGAVVATSGVSQLHME